jgi:hypothetical protein
MLCVAFKRKTFKANIVNFFIYNKEHIIWQCYVIKNPGLPYFPEGVGPRSDNNLSYFA